MHGGARLRVEPGERLVHQQQTRLADEAAGERNPAAHAARQLMRIGLGEVGKPDEGERVARAPPPFRGRHRAGLERERHIGERDPPGQQAIVLEHVADPAPVDRAGGVLRPGSGPSPGPAGSDLPRC